MDTKETKRIINIFAVASFLNDLGSDMIYPIWPLFVTGFIGANMTILGLIDGLGEAMVSISQALSGYISDRIRKRKIFVWIGYSLASLSRVGYGLSTHWLHLIPFKMLDRGGKIRGAPRDAIIADISTKENRGQHFGLLRAMDNFGAVSGILLCIFLFSKLGYRKILFMAAIPSLVGALEIFLYVKEKKTPNTKIYKGISFSDFDKNFKLFLLLSSFFALGAFSYSFLLIYAKEFGVKTTFVPVLYLIYTVTAAFVSFPFGKLADKIGRKSVLLLSYIFWVILCLLIILYPPHVAVYLIFILYGLHKGALEPVQKTFVSELAPKEFKASSLGGFQMVVGLCALPSSLIAGILWDKMGILAPFYFSFLLSMLSIIILFFIQE